MENGKVTWKQIVYPLVGACQEVHRQLGPYLNEYMYQDALAMELLLRDVSFDKEYYFTATYKGQIIDHKHFVDFRVMNGDIPIIVECKAVETLADCHRQQLWNYMRLTGVNYGMLYNFGPVYAQCEKYHYDQQTSKMIAF